MVSYWDEAMGNITAAYKAKGMWERTLVVMTTDNGGP
jgi:arylsulfatase A-like enzyme